MFVSYQKNYAVPLVIYEHVYEVSSLYDIGKLGFQNPCFSTDSREIYILRTWQGPQKLFRGFFIFSIFFDFFDFFARTVYITIQSDRVYRYVYIDSRHFWPFCDPFAALSLTEPKQMVTIWTSRFEDLSLNCVLG